MIGDVLWVGSLLVVGIALGSLVGRRLRWMLPPPAPRVVREAHAPVITPAGAPSAAPVAEDSRPVGSAHVPFAGNEANPGEAWLALGDLPVSARQLALVMARLPVGTTLFKIARDEVNGGRAMRIGFKHWSFVAPDLERYPNGARIWVAWSDAECPVISWPLWSE